MSTQHEQMCASFYGTGTPEYFMCLTERRQAPTSNLGVLKPLAIKKYGAANKIPKSYNVKATSNSENAIYEAIKLYSFLRDFEFTIVKIRARTYTVVIPNSSVHSVTLGNYNVAGSTNYANFMEFYRYVESVSPTIL